MLSAWSGIRPLVVNPNAKDTQSIARNHIIEVSANKLITIAGGKWTTYRRMAEETVDRAIKEFQFKPERECATTGLMLDGAHTYTPTLFIRLIQDFGLDNQVWLLLSCLSIVDVAFCLGCSAFSVHVRRSCLQSGQIGSLNRQTLAHRGQKTAR